MCSPFNSLFHLLGLFKKPDDDCEQSSCVGVIYFQFLSPSPLKSGSISDSFIILSALVGLKWRSLSLVIRTPLLRLKKLMSEQRKMILRDCV